jgi:hypothetical protein
MPILDQVTTRASMIDLIEAMLQDTSNAIWSAATVGQALDDALVEAAIYRPYVVKETLTTTASRELDIGDITDMIGIEELEYKVDEYPRQLRNFDIYGDTLRMDVENEPAASEGVYLFCRKVHHCDADWEASTAYTKGQFVAPTTKNGYRYECTTAGTSDSSEPATWGTTAGGETSDGTVKWTCRAEKSHTLDRDLEPLVVRLAAAHLALDVAVDHVNAVNQGGARAPLDYQTWGQRELAAVYSRLRRLAKPRVYRELPRY